MTQTDKTMNRHTAWSHSLWRRGHLGLILFSILVYGCASQPHVSAYIPQKSTCCTTIGDFKFQSIPVGSAIDFKITAGESTYSFSGSPEHFVAFKIPGDFVPTVVLVKSYLSTDFLPNATAVVPELIFLDAQFGIIGRSGLDNVKRDGEFWRGAAYSGKSLIPVNARYIVVVAGKGRDLFPHYPSENGRYHTIPPAALGELSLRLFGESATK